MVKRIAISMVEGLLDALAALSSPYQPGDMSISAAASKPRWLRCEGQEVSRAEYPDLFDAIGTTFGPGNGGTTFNLPDARGRALIGTGSLTAQTSARVLGAFGGAENHVLTEAQMPEHTHPLAGNSINASGGGSLHAIPGTGGNVTGSRGGSEAHPNMQPWLAAHVYIYAGV